MRIEFLAALAAGLSPLEQLSSQQRARKNGHRVELVGREAWSDRRSREGANPAREPVSRAISFLLSTFF